jgi:uncharacterized membrane protein (GlpM family)
VHQVFAIAIKGLAGGLLVVAFALLSQALAPKRFSGLFSAAPAVAIAGLTVTLLSKGHHDARLDSLGMIAGSAGMVAYAAAAVPLLRRIKAPAAAAVALTAWFGVTAIAAIPVLLA